MGQLPPTHDQRSQTFPSHVCSLFVKPVVGGYDGAHHRVCSLLVEPDFPCFVCCRSFQVFAMHEMQDDPHALAFRSKREDIEYTHSDDHTRCVDGLQCNGLSVSMQQLQAYAFGPFHYGDFVRGGGLIGSETVAIHFFCSGCDVVTQSQCQDEIPYTRAYFSSGPCRRSCSYQRRDVSGRRRHERSGFRSVQRSNRKTLLDV